jgi:hypothetical protein
MVALGALRVASDHQAVALVVVLLHSCSLTMMLPWLQRVVVAAVVDPEVSHKIQLYLLQTQQPSAQTE